MATKEFEGRLQVDLNLPNSESRDFAGLSTANGVTESGERFNSLASSLIRAWTKGGNWGWIVHCLPCSPYFILQPQFNGAGIKMTPFICSSKRQRTPRIAQLNFHFKLHRAFTIKSNFLATYRVAHMCLYYLNPYKISLHSTKLDQFLFAVASQINEVNFRKFIALMAKLKFSQLFCWYFNLHIFGNYI